MNDPVYCTTATVAQLAEARVLAHSLVENGDAGRLRVLVIDDRERDIDDSAEPFDVLLPEDLGLSARDFHERAAYLGKVELARALEPTLLRTLLEGDSAGVVHLEPSTVVYAPPSALSAALDESPVAVVAIAAAPLAHDGRVPSERDALDFGLWEPGFVGVGTEAMPFLRWWEERNRLYAAPRWIDIAAAYFDLARLDDPGYEVSFLNVLSRNLEWRDGRYETDGVPLTSFVFKGFDPRRPWVLSSLQGGHPRVLLSENPDLARLCVEHAEALLQSGFEAAHATRYGWSQLPDGEAMTPWLREPVRDAVFSRATGLSYERPPDPFDSSSLADFYRWLAEPELNNEHAPATARFFVPIYRARPDIREEFPELSVADAGRFRTWAERHGSVEFPVPGPVITAAFGEQRWPKPPEVRLSDRARLRPGFFVTGYLKAELGVGDAARRALQSMREAKIPSGALSYEVTKSRQGHVGELGFGEEANFDTNVVWVNADQLYHLIRYVGPAFYDGRYTVGCWAWETENPSRATGEMSRFVDEIWVPSEFTAAAIRSVTKTPVFVFEHPVTVSSVDSSIDPSALGVPEGFVFFFMFDFLSTVARKNPIGVVESFCRAFRPGEGPTLVLKAINGQRVPLDDERVRLAIGDRPDIVFIDEYLTTAECTALLARADCYVSLHRAEGFGLTIAEAMALAKPVIATAYSGNLDFMDDKTAYLVPATRSRVGPGAEPYPADGIWGEPDLDVAADHLRRVYEAQDEARTKGRLGREIVLSEHGPERAVRFLTSRFADIQQKRRAGYESRAVEAARQALAERHWTRQEFAPQAPDA